MFPEEQGVVRGEGMDGSSNEKKPALAECRYFWVATLIDRGSN